MICISVTPSSRTLAPADMLNAARHGDLIELCLDHFIKEPNVGDLIKIIDKPVMISCRRPKDGGQWKGSETERIQLLRSAIVANPAYVELDLDIANSIPRFGQTKRVVSYTSLNRPLSKIDDIFERCWKAKADIVKVTWPTESLDAAWPMLAAVSEQRELPVVGFGIGKAGLTFSLLGRKYGSPWIYAALERGMESFPEQPTVWELRGDYRLDDIGPKTRFLGIIGFGRAENTTARILNAAFRMMDKPIRCLPLIPDDLSRLPKMLSVMKINGLIVDPSFDGDLSALQTPRGVIAESSGFVDVVMHRKEGWSGTATLPEAVDLAGRQITGSENWAGKGAIMICGCGPVARAAAKFFESRGGAVSLAAPSDNAAATAARSSGVRHVSWNALHDVRLDTLVLADHNLPCGNDKGALNPMAIRQKNVVVDLTTYPRESTFGVEARARGAVYIEPSTVFAQQLRLQFRLLAGRDLPEDAFRLGLEDL
jgi:3-dehydroquinate dehydratase / shikimate dehydrogenase